MEMFEDPVSNTIQWDIVTVGNVLDEVILYERLLTVYRFSYLCAYLWFS